MKILLVDDHPVVLDGMSKMLASVLPADEIRTASSVTECTQVAHNYKPELVILDLRLPDGSGLDVCRFLKSEYPNMKVLLFSGSPGIVQKRDLDKSGADGWLSKNSSAEAIVEAIQIVSDSGTYFPDSDSTIKYTNNEIYISPREKEVLALIAEGLVNKEIADRLFISVTTVDSHRKNLLLKFNVSNTAALIAEAFKRGYLQLG